MSLNFSKNCIKKLKEKNVDGDLVQSWVKNTTKNYFNNKSLSEVISWEKFENILNGEFWKYYEIREDSITNINELVISELRNDKNLQIGILDFGPLYALGPHGRRWQNGVNLDKILSMVDEIHPTFYFTDLDLTKSKYETYIKVLQNQKNMIPAIRTILPQTVDQENLQKQLEIFDNDAAGFSFYNYSFMNFENLDWINTSVQNLS